jgi:hypothetical protein
MAPRGRDGGAEDAPLGAEAALAELEELGEPAERVGEGWGLRVTVRHREIPPGTECTSGTRRFGRRSVRAPSLCTGATRLLSHIPCLDRGIRWKSRVLARSNPGLDPRCPSLLTVAAFRRAWLPPSRRAREAYAHDVPSESPSGAAGSERLAVAGYAPARRIRGYSGGSVARGGHLDLRAQAELPSARRTETPTRFRGCL